MLILLNQAGVNDGLIKTPEAGIGAARHARRTLKRGYPFEYPLSDVEL
ncbi:MAG: hypothetical protein K8R76_12645 [Candidatus Aegiribacteria sp.]|nr:hypothetical protein [Candidatus Aegiribacteria sp.]